MRIYLIGFMGCGKSTLGKKLAKKLNYEFIDTDKLIEFVEKKPLSEVFAQKGEDYFRKLEADILHSTILYKNAIISCGGGTPCFYNNMEWINDRGQSIYLKMSPEQLYGRLKTRKEKRPLIADMSNAQLKDYVIQKLAEREAFYLQAHIHYDTKTMKIKDILTVLKND